MYQHTSNSVTLALIGLMCTLFLSTPVKAQLLRGHCKCEDLPPSPKAYLINEEKAIKLVNEMLADVKKYARIRFNETIQVKQTDCPIPSALLCGVRLNGRLLREERLIIYNNDYIDRISKEKGVLTWVDWHILAHEIGHHVLGHLGSSKPFIPIEKLYGQETSGKKRASARYAIDSPQAHEFEADFFGLWLLSRTNEHFPFGSFINSFDTTYIHSSGLDSPKPVNQSKKPGSSVESSSHPFFGDRLWAMKQFWNKLQTEQRTTLAKASYFSNAASAAYIELHPERAFWDLGFVAGLTVAGKPMFTINGQSVDGLLYSLPDAYNIYAGLNVSRFQWHNPWRYEAEVAYSTQKYGTTLGDGSAKRLIETLDLRYLTVFPKVTWSPLGQRSRSTQFISSRVGFFASAGPILRLPLGFDYQNYATTVAPANVPTLQPSVNPRVSIGVELLKKTLLPRGYKLALSYEYQGIRLNANPLPKALSHNFDITLNYAFARW